MIELQTVWGWQPALYLFLGGVGAGAFFVAGLVHLVTKSHQRVVSIAMWCSILFLAFGLGLLILELTAPLRALMMWQSFSNMGSSWMAIGAWLLFGGMACFFVSAVMNTETLCRALKISQSTRTKLDTIFTILGMVVGLCIAIYTGILLMKAPGVPFWNTGLLPVLFTVSALDTGVAFLAILFALAEQDEHTIPRVFEIATACLIIAEAIVLTLFLTSMLAGGNPLFETMEPGYGATAAASASSWINGQLSIAFWGLLVAIGLIVPFALAIVQVAHRPKHARAVALCSALCVLAGGCTLRFITLLAGSHVDIVANTVAMLL